jgi:peptidoglycan/LPS O-acetylase OafA/YrhL
MGILRLFLALCVIAGHAQAPIFGAIGPAWSTYAVLVFFIISGFYMAMVMDTKYKWGPIREFYISRALRIYPVYWAALIFSAILLFICKYPFFSYFHMLPKISKIYAVFSNLFIFGQDEVYYLCVKAPDGSCAQQILTTINSPGWSIAVELLFYLMAPFCIRSLARSSCLLTLGAIFFVLARFVNIADFQTLFGNPTLSMNASIKYYFFPASWVFFGAGACSYYAIYKVAAGQATLTPIAYAAGIVLVVLISLNSDLPIAWWQLATLTATVPGIFAVTKNIKVDRLIGELSYPVYMFHYAIVWTFNYYKLGGADNPAKTATLAALVSIAVGGVAYLLIDRTVDRWRHRRWLRKAEAAQSEVPPNDLQMGAAAVASALAE